jgi:hypothetical protein
MSLVLALAGCLGEAAIVYAVVILARLSEKLGAVTKMPPYYKGFYIALGLLCLSLASRLVHISTAFAMPGQTVPLLTTEGFYLLTPPLPLALGMSLSMVISGRYWGWLVKE